jgi:hypothetical protein
LRRNNALKLGVFAGILNSSLRYYSVTNSYDHDIQLFEKKFYEKTVVEEEAPQFPDLSKTDMAYGLVYGSDKTGRYHPQNFKKSIKYLNE